MSNITKTIKNNSITGKKRKKIKTEISENDGNKSQPSHGEEDYWVVKIDTLGNKLWDKRFGGSESDLGYSITPTNDGNYILAGQSRSTNEGDKSGISRGGCDYWIVKIDENGSKIWDKTLGGSGNDRGAKVISTGNGNFVISGRSNGNGGDITQNGFGGNDYWVIKIDENGTKNWDKKYGAGDHDQCQRALKTNDGGYLLSGISKSNNTTDDKSEPSRGDHDFWIVKIDSLGNKTWDKTFGGTEFDSCRQAIVTADGGYLLVGDTNSSLGGDITQSGQGGRDYWIVKIDALGNKLWDKRLGIRKMPTVKS